MSKTVLITGASRGIGADTARLFAAQGWNVAINYNRSGARADALAAELKAQGTAVMAVQADITDVRQVQDMVRQVQAQFGGIHALVNNAGIAQQLLFTDITAEDWDRMFDVNVKGMYHCTQAVVRGMIDSHVGKIINLSSIWGIAGGSCEVHYSAAKAAVIGFTKALAKELGLSNIQVNCVAPGVIDTEMNAALPPDALAQLKEETPLGVIGQGSDVANLIYFLASDQSNFITGQIISPNGGLVI
ncbi:elongation factor P 5-aminopentanone reductase [Hydrogenoanaerobacterium sp.]|uniref:elongation factor P 5-aminopentanone reductase n=1 Tax=Hydrogenoanaerobacterium sp. TaxID=2953763 RepID=UPI00289C4CE3|nr:3-oxoacyl-ACP reductase FabG [Hydrogenoanaerobacterium sp.]